MGASGTVMRGAGIRRHRAPDRNSGCESSTPIPIEIAGASAPSFNRVGALSECGNVRSAERGAKRLPSRSGIGWWTAQGCWTSGKRRTGSKSKNSSDPPPQEKPRSSSARPHYAQPRNLHSQAQRERISSASFRNSSHASCASRWPASLATERSISAHPSGPSRRGKAIQCT